ncbi:sugar ABC transporter substrate-binding protein [Diplocloster modestus]|uniref:Sugar ABC transporter substrate-binding protein n=1 Tax=Diplocloster modestus TaxID=2850322 RepID=A0ABS6K1L6_9FIRM|nr:sugar ABC transporter substrate-binding protein [Diplocloster modestus]MBU9724729.1 sugar ABC transporter substrate-binding protein [Diplocloster modestus]
MKKRVTIFAGLLMTAALVCTACSAKAEDASTQTKDTPKKTAQEETPAAAETPADKNDTSNGEFKTEGLKIAYTCQDLTNTYFVEVSRGVQARCDELGIEVNIVDGKADVANQITAFENFISQKLDGIIISPIDETALVPSVKAAQDAGIPVISGNQLVEGSDAFITVPEYEYGFAIGEEAGKWIKEKLDGKAKVAIFDYPELESVIERGNGIQAGILSQAPDADIVARQSANNAEKGMANMENILQANPDVEVLACVNDAGALGAYEAVMAAHKDSDRFFIGGLDATDEALNKIKEGGIYRATVDIQPFESGKLFVDILIKVMQEGPIEETINIPMKVVNASNISDYKE